MPETQSIELVDYRKQFWKNNFFSEVLFSELLVFKDMHFLERTSLFVL